MSLQLTFCPVEYLGNSTAQVSFFPVRREYVNEMQYIHGAAVIHSHLRTFSTELFMAFFTATEPICMPSIDFNTNGIGGTEKYRFLQTNKISTYKSDPDFDVKMS